MTKHDRTNVKAHACSRELPGGTRRRHRTLYCNVVFVVCAVVGVLRGANSFAADGGWEYQPYRVRVLLAIDAPGGMAEELGRRLPEYLQQRADAATAPRWQVDANLATGSLRAAILHSFTGAVDLPLSTELTADRDKLMLLGITWRPNGFALTAREFDVYLERWGNVTRRECRQETVLAEDVFALLCETFAPVAQFEVDPTDPKQVKLTPRGAALPANAEGRPWCQPGDVFLPLLRRTARNGQLEKNGILPVAWTYIEAVPGKDKGLSQDRRGLAHFAESSEQKVPVPLSADDSGIGPTSLRFAVRSGNRRPFMTRRQARVEQLAIAVPSGNDPTTLHLHARNHAEKALVGYEVLAEGDGPDATTRIGVSDVAGEVTVPPGSRRIEMLQIKHGSQLLAKLPVVCGAERRVEVPLPDDDARLTAEMRLAVVREDLIDVVARRNILMARARQKIEKKDYKAADELLRALDDLPGNPQFNLTLTNEARVIRSDDPQIQRRIDQLFKATQMLTTKFLDLRPINQIHDELREARQVVSEKPKG